MSDAVADGSETRPIARRRDQHASTRGLPGSALVVLFIVVASSPLIAARLSGVEPVGRLQELATGLGLVAAALIVLQFLSSGRYEVLSGRIGIDRTMGFHRIASLMLLAAAVLHPLLYVLAAALVEPAIAWPRLKGMVTSPRYGSGVLALSGLAVMIALALLRGRLNIKYEVWRATHGALAIVIAGASLHHALKVGAYSPEWPVIAVWGVLAATAVLAMAVVYVVRPMRMWREPWQVVRVEPQGEGIWELTLAGPLDTNFTFRAGQFIWMTLHPHRPPLHDHPFSIASAPGELPTMRLIVREAGDCTRAIGAIAAGTPVAFDGPHGSFVLRDGGELVVMIAGGAGVAPILAMLEDAARAGDRRKFRLLYAARSGRTLPGVERLRMLQGQLDLVVDLYFDAPPLTDGAKLGPIGRDDVMGAVIDPTRTTAYVCGPPGLMAAATDMLLEAGVPAQDVHYERFDYSAGGSRIDRARRREALATLAGVGAAAVLFSLT